MNVDLPAPFGPSIAVCSPLRIVSLSDSRTRTPSSTTLASRNSISGALAGNMNPFAHRDWYWIMADADFDRVVVLVADAIRLRAIREASPFPYRVLYFTDSNLESALGTVAA